MSTEPTTPTTAPRTIASTEETSSPSTAPATEASTDSSEVPAAETTEVPATDAPEVPGSVPATGSGERPVVQLTVQGLFPVQAPFLPSGPQAVLYADGTLLVPERASPTIAPLVWPYRQGHLDPSVVTRLLDEAAAAGLLGDPPNYGPPIGVSDPPRTTLVLTTADGVFTHTVDGLTATTTDAARLALQAFTGKVASLEMGIDTTPYEPTAIAIVAAPATAAGGSANLTAAWPDDAIDLAAATGCTRIEDAADVALLQSSPRGTAFTQHGTSYVLAAGVITPGSNC